MYDELEIIVEKAGVSQKRGILQTFARNYRGKPQNHCISYRHYVKENGEDEVAEHEETSNAIHMQSNLGSRT
jgi:hypothetical protein